MLPENCKVCLMTLKYLSMIYDQILTNNYYLAGYHGAYYFDLNIYIYTAVANQKKMSVGGINYSMNQFNYYQLSPFCTLIINALYYHLSGTNLFHPHQVLNR